MNEAAKAYLRAALDQLAAATRDHDEPAGDDVVRRLVDDDHPEARAAIAEALRKQPDQAGQPDPCRPDPRSL